MNTAIKIFLTYAIISMFAGLIIGFGVLGNFIPDRFFSWFMPLWLGPVALACAFGVPVTLWRMWAAR